MGVAILAKEAPSRRHEEYAADIVYRTNSTCKQRRIEMQTPNASAIGSFFPMYIEDMYDDPTKTLGSINL